MKNLSPPGRLVERLLYIHSNYSFTIEHKRSEEIPHVDYLSRDGCTGNPTAEKSQMENDTKEPEREEELKTMDRQRKCANNR